MALRKASLIIDAVQKSEHEDLLLLIDEIIP
jgi:hypothetical protein